MRTALKILASVLIAMVTPFVIYWVGCWMTNEIVRLVVLGVAYLFIASFVVYAIFFVK